jgi:hypothetical protein
VLEFLDPHLSASGGLQTIRVWGSAGAAARRRHTQTIDIIVAAVTLAGRVTGSHAVCGNRRLERPGPLVIHPPPAASPDMPTCRAVTRHGCLHRPRAASTGFSESFNPHARNLRK